MITREQVEDCLTFIAESDSLYAEAKTEVERASWLCKHVRAVCYLDTDREAKVDERKNEVERHEKVAAAEDRRILAILAFEKIKAERETKALLIEVFRTLESSRRAGIV